MNGFDLLEDIRIIEDKIFNKEQEINREKKKLLGVIERAIDLGGISKNKTAELLRRKEELKK